MRQRHVVALLDHSDHNADTRCPCRPEPIRDLTEPALAVYLHHRPIPEPAAARTTRAGSAELGHGEAGRGLSAAAGISATRGANG